MSITGARSNIEINWRTIDIDALDPESSSNFDLTTLTPAVAPVSTADVQTLAGQIKQLLRGGDSEGALRGALENVPYGADESGKAIHLATVTEILQSIRQAEITPICQRIFQSEGGSEVLDTLMKYLYKGMAKDAPSGGRGTPQNVTPQPTGFSQIGGRSFGQAQEGGGQAMSVLLSWHEKLIELVGPGSIVRVMSDRRTV
ncbi:hypothetical protein CERZMDRAFT_91131 [Cercospora zeae-maydis SCOH1-5]|uniref:Actin-related protein 2/3 complex subunit 5 n=1 Tax=Cercospora zeae-maydis SCOH1-5 TaxID=717836 RepID=A0A6A6FBB7_9PEZI|nr:hypothetical protein CERZMDRAFT_91131 [Cercospora zeae-maydis SCOH1-5]